MDDMEDDARYPSNPYHPRGYFSSSSSSFARPRNPANRIPPPSQISRRYPPSVDEEDDEDAPNGMIRPMDEEEEEEEEVEEEEEEDDDNEAGGRRRAAADRVGGSDDEDDEDSSSGSSGGRGKRRRIDRHALGFEFAPRVPPQATASPKTPARSSTTDWSDGATSVLLDAWGDRFVQNGRKSLRSDEWSEVAKIVSQASKIARSDAQCRNRVDTLKKKYKKEKSRLAMDHSNSSSNWVHFQRMDALMSPLALPPPSTGRQRQHHQPPRLACGVDAGEYVFTRSSAHQNLVNGNDEMRDSPGDTGTEDDGDDEEDDSDGLPPSKENASRSSSSFRMLADSIQKFGEIYEKMENNKRQQMTELERMRKEFQRDLELQKKQILERAQAEIAKLREEEGDDGDDEDEDDDDDDDDNDNSGSAENLSG